MKKGGHHEELRKYLFFATIFLLIFLSFKIIQPYIIIIISAFILSYLARPLYLKLNKKLNNNLSATICIILILLVVLIPLGGIIGGITNQAYGLIGNENFSGVLNKISSSPVLSKFNTNIDWPDIFEKGIFLLISLLSSAISYIPALIISLIVLIFGIYYILTNWDNLARELKDYLPFQDKIEISKEIDTSTKGIIYGSLLIAIIEFIVAGLGFYIFGVNLYFLLPSLIFFLAFIPGLGPTVVWVPLAIYYLFVKDWFTMVGVIITGVVLSLYIDIILRTKILGGKLKINSFIMLIGILGGISLFGIFGFILGPLVLIYSLKILRELVNE